MTDTLSTILQYLESDQGDPYCRALLEDAVAEIEALRRKQAYLTNTWRDHAEHLRRHAAEAGSWGHIGDQIRSNERAQMFEDRVRELGGME